MESLHQMVSWVKSQKYTNRWEKKKRLTQVVILQSEVDPNKKNVHLMKILNVIIGATQSMVFFVFTFKDPVHVVQISNVYMFCFS